MALRDLPYFPFYTQDFASDEKVRMCSPATIGIYIFLLCILHKAKGSEYGKFKVSTDFVYTKPDTKEIV